MILTLVRDMFLSLLVMVTSTPRVIQAADKNRELYTITLYQLMHFCLLVFIWHDGGTG